ncbi:MAG: hypothetical protein QXT45_04090 [Candidatus Bilamarchaeaceae archaeon]
MLYSELINAVRDWLARPDLDSQIAQFIDRAQEQINGNLYIRENLKNQSIVYSTSNPQQYPSGLLKIVSLQVSVNGHNYALTPTSWALFNQLPPATAIPRVYTMASDGFYVWPLPASSLSGSIIYFERFANISSSQSNWVLENEPRLYLYGALVQAEPYLAQDPRLEMWKRFLSEAMEEVARRYAV